MKSQFAIEMRRVRRARDLSQEQLAFFSKISRTTIVNYESGKTEPSVTIAMRIAKVLELSIDNLINGGQEVGKTG